MVGVGLGGLLAARGRRRRRPAQDASCPTRDPHGGLTHGRYHPAHASNPPRTYFSVWQRLFRGYGPLAVFALLLLLMSVLVPTKTPEGVEHRRLRRRRDRHLGAGGHRAPAAAADPVHGAGTAAPPEHRRHRHPRRSPAPGGREAAGAGHAPARDATARSPATRTRRPASPSRATTAARPPPASPTRRSASPSGCSTNAASSRPLPSSPAPPSRHAADRPQHRRGARRVLQPALPVLRPQHRDRLLRGRRIQHPELVGKGRAQAEADAREGGRLGVFADLSATSEPYANALCNRASSPSATPTSPGSGTTSAAPAPGASPSTAPRWPSSPLSSPPSALPAATPTSPAARQGAASPDRHARPGQPLVPGVRAGRPAATRRSAAVSQGPNYEYLLDLGQLSNQASNLIPRMKADGVTTVICGCDPIFPVFLSGVAARENFFPEFIIAGTALTDADVVGSSGTRSSRPRLRGQPAPGLPAPTQTIAYQAFKSVRPGRSRRSRSTSSTTRCTCSPSASRERGPSLTPETLPGRACTTTSRARPGGALGLRAW